MSQNLEPEEPCPSLQHHRIEGNDIWKRKLSPAENMLGVTERAMERGLLKVSPFPVCCVGYRLGRDRKKNPLAGCSPCWRPVHVVCHRVVSTGNKTTQSTFMGARMRLIGNSTLKTQVILVFLFSELIFHLFRPNRRRSGRNGSMKCGTIHRLMKLFWMTNWN